MRKARIRIGKLSEARTVLDKLPSNYRVAAITADCVYIDGEDIPGATLEDIADAEEITDNRPWPSELAGQPA